MSSKSPLQYKCVVTRIPGVPPRAVCNVSRSPGCSDYVCGVTLQTWTENVRLYLGTKQSVDEALQLCLRYARSYFDDPPMSAEEFLLWKRRRWPSLFKTRMEALDEVFFGGGDEWFDGRLVDIRPEFAYDHPDHVWQKRLMAWQFAHPDEEIPEDITEKELAEISLPLPPAPEYLPDDGEDCVFTAAFSHENNLTKVPDNVTDDWLELASEAAKALRDRTLSREGDCAEVKELVRKSREMGREMVIRLEKMKEQRRAEREASEKNSFEAKCTRVDQAKAGLDDYRRRLDTELGKITKASGTREWVKK